MTKRETSNGEETRMSPPNPPKNPTPFTHTPTSLLPPVLRILLVPVYGLQHARPRPPLPGHAHYPMYVKSRKCMTRAQRGRVLRWGMRRAVWPLTPERRAQLHSTGREEAETWK
ncbi:hypothetical protein AGOR_G00234300 [Albula goreensis]|uniref:Uncharacterized protein n=1 Tax=Albula goreensis TaxID=1534307 RepID=A0A8T3CLS1_9TELE|nr:hypothetical protein AGOR_G00234300 [Albula goreensis]